MGLQDLKRLAEITATARGHQLRVWDTHHGEHRSCSATTCRKCEAWISTSTRPLPNEAQTAGTALALNCR